MHEVNRQKYLVTWVEPPLNNAPGFVRGQATQTREDAERMFNHVITTGCTYAEVREIGGLARVGDRTLQYTQTEEHSEH